MNRFSCLIRVAFAIILVCMFAVSVGCSFSKNEGFAIYLTKEDIPPAQMPVLSHFDLAEQPLITVNDVISYNAQTYEITLTSKAFDLISKLEVPVRGKSFAVCVDKTPLYWGAFWTPVSSISFDGVAIWKPLGTQDSKTITLELGYPSPSFYGGEDPRNNPKILESLKQSGKLISPATGDLPHSMKGYELYSWLEGSQWHFTLIIGTNRNKMLEEIISTVNTIRDDGWVHLHVVGVEEIKTVLGRIPQGELIFWLGGLREGQTSQGAVNMALPSIQTIDVIKEQARSCGLNLAVFTP